MSVKIKISYETLRELQRVLDLLKPNMRKCKKEKGDNGKYKKAYVELDV